MGTVVSIIFLAAVLGMVVVYPLYFYFLNEFGKWMAIHHPAISARLSAGFGMSGLPAAYRALQLSRGGKIDGVPLSIAALEARKKAAVTLYLGMMFFLVSLAIFLVDAVSAGKY